MLSCENFRGHLSDFLDGALDSARAVEISAHLDGCAACRAEYHALRNTVEMLRGTSVPDGSLAQKQALANLRYSIRVAEPTRSRSFGSFRFAAVGLAAAAMLAVTIQTRLNGPSSTVNYPSNSASSVNRGSGLPTSMELDEMASLHAVHSFAVAAGDAGDQQETLADATSRLR